MIETFRFSAPCRPGVAFGLISDLRNADRWDPRTVRVRKTTIGDVGQGTCFLLHARLARGIVLALPYRIVSYEPPYRVTFAGRAFGLAYWDRVVLSSSGAVVVVAWTAHLSVASLPDWAERPVRKRFRAVGDEATRGIAALLGSAAPA